MDPVAFNSPARMDFREGTRTGELTSIWEHILRRSPIRAEENFFDIGGDAVLATQLFEEIAHVYGQDLPAETISRAPTIKAQAALLENPNLPRFSTLVPLRVGDVEPPVFLVHGLDGGLMKITRMARSIATSHSVIGFQARGFDGQEPLDRVEGMALPYVAAIRERQPHGPYFLIGYSLGGMIALEMARHLLANGEKVELLAMIDSYPHLRQLPPGLRVQVMARRAKRHVSTMARMSAKEIWEYVGGRLQHRSRIARAAQDQGASPTSAAQVAQRVTDKGAVALRRYRPMSVYPGRIRFIRSATTSWFPKDPAPIWAKLAEGFDCETVPGDHLSMMSHQFESVAAVLSRYLKEAFGEK